MSARQSETTRIAALDTLRGVAVMGILLLNIIGFAMPQAAYSNPRAYGGWHGADLAVWAINAVFFDGRMRALFSLLFGASTLLVIERAEAAGRSPAVAHFSRMGWLLLFGLAHLWLVWEGDILALYALIGMAAFRSRKLPVERLLVLGLMLACANAVIFAAVAAPLWQSTPDPHALESLIRGFGTPPSTEIARELALYRGDYATILADRFRESRFGPIQLAGLYGPETLAYMLFGMAALRTGMLTGAWPRARYRRWLLVCWGVTLPLYAALAWWMIASGFALAPVLLATFVLGTPLRLPMMLGWVCLILLLARPGGALTTRIAAAGRMAFSNYLLTSLICTTLFYGYGLDRFGTLSRWQCHLVVMGVWAAMLLWSKPWLARFRYGPLEWAWRSLSRFRFEPMRGPARA